MADRMDTADNADRLLAALSRLFLERQAARYVLENATPKPSNWATQLHDYRRSLANQKLAAEVFDGFRAALRGSGLPDATLQTLAEEIEKIAPNYPSWVDQKSRQ